ncbi:MAG: amidase family protein [Pseudomonadota bacterium]
MDDLPLLDRPARAIVALLRDGALSPSEALDVVEARVGNRDQIGAHPVNALPTLCFERAREHATNLETRPASERGLLAGLPIPIKDMTDVSGVRTTYGSPIFADNVAARSDELVTRLEARGGVVFAKSNTPEWAAGGNTFNDVFGATRNPHDHALTAGGSSGGAAAALAHGMAWLAHGSDLGGSLRTPATFCGVCGLRPTPGRIGHGPGGDLFNDLSVEGPMARDIGDLGLGLDAMAGATPLDPISFDTADGVFFAAAQQPKEKLRIVVTEDCGLPPVHSRMRAAFRRSVERLADAGVEISEELPDYSATKQAFQTLRAVGFAQKFLPMLETHRDALKPEVIWNAEKGLELTAEEIVNARLARSAMTAATLELFASGVDAILCPGASMPAFPVETRYPDACEGVAFENYMDWLTITFVWSLQGLPVISMPSGSLDDGMPFGVQVIGAPRGEAALLSAAARIEQILS